MAEPGRILAAFGRLRVDDWAAEVIEAMRERGIRAILLKGPAVARWLYPDDPENRVYRDVDLMVSPADTGSARALLVELGFLAEPHPLDDQSLHAWPYLRQHDGAGIDLHRTLHGVIYVPPECAWQAVSSGTDTMRVGDVDVEVPAIPVRLLHLVLQLEPGDGPESMAWQEIERAIAKTELADWHQAVEAARRLGVEPELAVRLRHLPDGAELADRLGLTHRGSAYYKLLTAVDSGRAPGTVTSVLGFALLTDTKSRISYLRTRLFPPNQVLLEKSVLARNGHLRLARAARPFVVLSRLPATLLAWFRHYR